MRSTVNRLAAVVFMAAGLSAWAAEKITDDTNTHIMDVDGNGAISVKYSDSTSLDAFGRARVSEPFTLFDSKQIFDNAPLFWDDEEVSGSGTSSVYSNQLAATRMSVSTNEGKRVRQTFMRFNYQPGKSQFVLMTARMVAVPTNGISARVGMFDDNNGVYFATVDGAIYAGIRSAAFGAITNTLLEQSDWIDPLDGTGASGFTLDPTKTQIMWWDYEWLGVGRVRCGFVVNGQFIQVAHFNNSNVKDRVYMSTPNLPLRLEVENDGTGPASAIDHICSTVMSEGGIENNGNLRYASTDGTHIVADVENLIYPVIGIRLQSAKIGAVIEMVEAQIQIQSANHSGEWLLKWNPVVSPPLTWTNEANSAVQTAVGSTNTVTGGTDFGGGFLLSSGPSGGGGGGMAATLDSAIYLGSSITNKLDELYLCFRPNDGSTTAHVEGSLTWRELK